MLRRPITGEPLGYNVFPTRTGAIHAEGQKGHGSIGLLPAVGFASSIIAPVYSAKLRGEGKHPLEVDTQGMGQMLSAMAQHKAMNGTEATAEDTGEGFGDILRRELGDETVNQLEAGLVGHVSDAYAYKLATRLLLDARKEKQRDVGSRNTIADYIEHIPNPTPLQKLISQRLREGKLPSSTGLQLLRMDAQNNKERNITTTDLNFLKKELEAENTIGKRLLRIIPSIGKASSEHVEKLKSVRENILDKYLSQVQRTVENNFVVPGHLKEKSGGTPAPQEGDIYKNPKTGERIIFKGGKWVRIPK